MLKKIIFLSFGFCCALNAMDDLSNDKEYKSLKNWQNKIDRCNALCFCGTYFGCGTVYCADTALCQTLYSEVGVPASSIAPLGREIIALTWLLGVSGVFCSNCVIERKKSKREKQLISKSYECAQEKREEKTASTTLVHRMTTNKSK